MARALGRGKLGGDLTAFSIFEVCQFLMIMKQTGTLSIKSGNKSGTITLSEGQIVGIVDNLLKEGEGAFYGIVTWSEGTFEFTPGPVAVPSGSKIGTSTDGLLLEAARLLDEGELEGDKPRDKSEQSYTRAFLENQAFATEFADLLFSLDGLPDDSLDFSKEVSLEKIIGVALNRKAGQVFLQVGDTPKARAPKGVISLGRSPVSQRAVDRITRKYFDDARKRLNGESGRVLWVETVIDGNGRVRIEYERVNGIDRLIVTSLITQPLALDAFGVSLESIQSILRAPRGIFLIASPPRGGKSMLAATLAAISASRSQRHVVFHQEARRYALKEQNGLLDDRDLSESSVRSSVMPEQIWERKADVLVFDAIRHAPQVDGALTAADSGALVIVAVEAYDVSDAVLRFVAQAEADEQASSAARLAQNILGILVVHPATQPKAATSERKGEPPPPDQFEAQLLPRAPGLPDAIRQGDLQGVQKYLIQTASKRSEDETTSGEETRKAS